MELRIFWTRLRVVPSTSEEPQGTTWLELFLLFSLCGGTASERLKPHLRQTHDRLFKAFRKGSKQLFRFASEQSRPLLKAAINRAGGSLAWPLGAYGIQARLPALPFKPALNQEGSAAFLHAGLCSYGGKVPKVQDLPTSLRVMQFKRCPWFPPLGAPH